jgi:hypothetical protein
LQEEINALRVKLDNSLPSKSAFSIDPFKYERFLNHSYKKHKNHKKDLNGKIISHRNLTCHCCCKKGRTIEKYKFRKILVHKGVSQWLPK